MNCTHTSYPKVSQPAYDQVAEGYVLRHILRTPHLRSLRYTSVTKEAPIQRATTHAACSLERECEVHSVQLCLKNFAGHSCFRQGAVLCNLSSSSWMSSAPGNSNTSKRPWQSHQGYHSEKKTYTYYEIRPGSVPGRYLYTNSRKGKKKTASAWRATTDTQL